MNGTMNVLPEKRWEHLSVSLDRSGFESTEIWNSDVIDPRSGAWVMGKALIGRVKNTFSLTFAARDRSPTNGPGTYGYVALASIKMTGCKSNRTFAESCGSYYQPFRCSNGKCTSPYYKCDFVDDCGDGSDESPALCADYKLRCDFESGWCNWGDYNRGSWFIDSGSSSLSGGPTRDHTKGKAIHYPYLTTYPTPNLI